MPLGGTPEGDIHGAGACTSVEGAENVYLGEVVLTPDVHYPEVKLLTQLFSIRITSQSTLSSETF